MRIILTIASFVINWFLFEKLGHEGWEGLIPIYNTFVLFQEIDGNGLRMLWLLCPIVNIIVIVKLLARLSRRFGKSGAFVLGLFFLAPVFRALLAFGPDQYDPYVD